MKLVIDGFRHQKKMNDVMVIFLKMLPALALKYCNK